jgi:hypothetical protein
MARRGHLGKNPTMNFKKTLFLMLTTAALYGQTPVMIDLQGGQTILEYTGQVTNAGIGSTQVGYLNYVKGFSNVFSGSTQDESTALFTFYTSVDTTRSVLNGSVRLVDREGTTTIYLANGAADFTHPDSFRSGTPIQTSSIHQQVVVDTITSGFTVSNFNVISSVKPFTLNGSTYQLGSTGQTFRTGLTGHLTTTAPPSGYFGGFATGTTDSVAFLNATPNPAPPVGSLGLVPVTLTWGAPGVSQVEIHVGSPDGPLFVSGGAPGTATTGAWVSDGTTFFLQDASGGKATSAANTLAQVMVIVR